MPINYIRDSELSTCTSTTSITDILGGLASFMMSYFKLKFPPNLFKETHIASSMLSNVLDKNIAHRKLLPFIGMEMNFTDETSMMGELTRHHFSQRFIANSQRSKYYTTVFHDKEKKIRVYVMSKRVRATFNFFMRFQTQAQAMNWVHYINNNFETNGMNFVNNIRLPVQLPKYFVDRIANKLGLDMKYQENRDIMIDYLRNNSLNGFRYVLNPTTGNHTFMYEYLTNILLTYTDKPSFEINETNLVVESSDVNFTIEAEINSPSGFILEVKDGDLVPIAPIDDENEHHLDFYIIPGEIPFELNDGKKLINQARFKTEINKAIDELNLKEILSVDLQQTLEALDEVKDFDMRNLFEYKLYANNVLVDPEKYDVSFSSHVLTIKNPDSNVTYAIGLYGDIRRLNDINELILNNKRHRIIDMLKTYSI